MSRHTAAVLSSAVSAPRVLLVHANPLQRVLPVPPYGLELVRAGLDGVAATCEIVDPFLTDERPLAAAVEAARRTSPDVIGLGLRVLEDCIPIDGLDERDAPLDVHSVIDEVRQLVAALREARPSATIVLGGAGFSACPAEALEALDVPLGVVGAGERAVPRARRAPRRRVPRSEPSPGSCGEASRSRRAATWCRPPPPRPASRCTRRPTGSPCGCGRAARWRAATAPPRTWGGCTATAT